MTTVLIAFAAMLVAYLVGSIPTAYLLVRAARGIDIRTVGSGNVGATNAGRVLGHMGFLAVFTLDLLKGYLPTALLPLAANRIAEHEIPGLAVFVAVLTILGHNFPVYLGFRGGKGVATSLGAMVALDPVASLAAVIAFALCLVASRMVSLSSLVGAAVFTATYFARVGDPWSSRNVVMSVAVVALAALLIWRHRANVVRITRGAEPRISLGRRGDSSKS
jgi:glycerol-3-phosphate acyltransferase PlsY